MKCITRLFKEKRKCGCKQLVTEPCKCPEVILHAFIKHFLVDNKYPVFYLNDFVQWFIDTFGVYSTALASQVLDLDMVEELGDRAIYTVTYDPWTIDHSEL